MKTDTRLTVRCRMFLITAIACVLLPFSIVPALAQSKGSTTDDGRITVKGTITDSEGEPLAGANVLVKGTTIGCFSDFDGNYSLTFPKSVDKTDILIYSFIGMENEEIKVSSSTKLNVTLSASSLDAVIVNGFYDQAKETFTGAATTISGDELVAVSPTSLIAGIAALTPGLVITESNSSGSNPNYVPEILVRGANSLITNESEEGVNNPLIVLDGVEISMEELYDLDIFDIERIDVLKDASATVLYGEKGANGVIVVERKRAEGSGVKISYNFVPKFSIPDLSSYNLCNAEQKLELERLAGLYDSSTDGTLDQAYDYKLQNIRKGVNTNWMKAPLRVPFSHTHSLALTNRTDKFEFRANANFSDTYGVMKGDNRRTVGITFNVGYHLQDKLTVNYKSSFSYTSSKDSPYGSFSDYVELNPYYYAKDENGDWITNFYWNPITQSGTTDANPLYDATLSSFSKSTSHSWTNSLTARWNITRNLYMTGQGSIGMSWSSSDTYESPESADNLLITDITKRGEYNWSNSHGTSLDGKIVVNYGRSLDTKGSMFRISGGATISYSKRNSSYASAIGFLKDELSDISFALSYPSTGSPSGSESLSTGVGFFVNGNFSLWNRYFIDASYRTSGSSKFGSDNSWAPFWSFGAGWNVHNESFARDWDWLNSLVFRYSLGYTGSVSFSYYQAKTIYKYSSSNQYYSGLGAVPSQMGNDNLKWQRTFKNNYGVTIAMIKNRINLSFDYYSNTTKDMLMSIDLPPSVGETSMYVNFGTLNNKGFDFSVSGQIIKTRNWLWTMTMTGSHVMDEIRKISSVLKNTEVTNSDDSLKPKILFQEGGSQFDIYCMRSAGIDPATGQEIFIKKNGEYTFNYDSDERVAVGNTNPALQGSWINSLRFKGFTLSVTTTYSFGSDYYNSTLQNKVENIDAYHNVDVRAFTERWKSAGDISRYLSIASTATTYYSERFVEKRNELYFSSIQLTYDFTSRAISRFGLRKLTVGIGVSDIGYISSIKFERGTSYPYCRGLNLIFRPTF